MVIEAAQGLGEKVVSGLVNPERVIVDKKAAPSSCAQALPGGCGGDGPVLTEEEIKTLTATALKIENFYHSAQDIEWAMMKNKLYILQSRPITK